MSTPEHILDITPNIEMTYMVHRDLPRVMEIEHHSFPIPWPQKVFEMQIESERATNFVARIDGVVCGYIISWRIYDEVHVLNVAVHPEFREMGIGQHLVESCLEYFADLGSRLALLEVRKSNETAKNLYLRLGFSRIGLRKKYYSDNGEDAIVMMKVFD